MKHDDMLRQGEDIAKEVVGRVLGTTTESTDLARMAVLVAHQLMMMGQVFSHNAGLDFVDVYREELDRAGRWHDDVARVIEQRGRAS